MSRFARFLACIAAMVTLTGAAPTLSTPTRRPVIETRYLGGLRCHIDLSRLQTVAYERQPRLLRFRAYTVCNYAKLPSQTIMRA